MGLFYCHSNINSDSNSKSNKTTPITTVHVFNIFWFYFLSLPDLV